MRIASGLFAALLLLASATSAAADTDAEQAGDRVVEAILSVPHDAILEQGFASDNATFMVSNTGNAVAFVIGCQNSCSQMTASVRAAGLPELTQTAGRSHRIIIAIPTAYAHSLSNFEITTAATCGASRGCIRHWALLAQGAALSLEQRGLPSRVSDAEWNAAQPASPGVQWQTLPSAEDMKFYYPLREWRTAATGVARLQCLMTTSQGVRCRAGEASSPAFAEAALKLSTVLRLRDTNASGQSMLNRQINVPIRFQPN